MNPPRISIITICYNSEAHIEEAIQSVVNQSYQNKEYIIIDGGSTDGTFAIIEKYKDKIDYFVSEPDRGISDAFNKGIKVATGDLIGIINSDDKLVDNALEILRMYYNPEIDIYRGLCGMWNDKTGTLFYDKPTMKWTPFPWGMHVDHPSTFIRASAYKKYGLYDKNLKFAMDFDMLMRLDIAKATKLFINQPLAIFRLGGVSQESDWQRLKELKNILSKNESNKTNIFLFDLLYHCRLYLKTLVNIGGTDFRLWLMTKM